MRYSLLDSDSGQVIGSFETEEAALNAAQSAVRYVDAADLVLQRDTASGPEFVAGGAQLIERTPGTSGSRRAQLIRAKNINRIAARVIRSRRRTI